MKLIVIISKLTSRVLAGLVPRRGVLAAVVELSARVVARAVLRDGPHGGAEREVPSYGRP